MYSFLSEKIRNLLGLRLLFSLITLFLIMISAFNAYRVLYSERISNDQCAWREIPGRSDAFVIREIVPGGVADNAGLKDGDILLKIDNNEITSDRTDTSKKSPMPLINRINEGDSATYLIERNGQQTEVKIKIIKVFDIKYLATLILGTVFLFVGFVVVMTKPKGQIQRQFFYYSCFVMLFAGLSSFNGDTVRPNLPLWIFFLTLIIISKSIAPVYFIYFFSYFPIYRKYRFSKIIISIIFAIALTTVLTLLINEQIILNQYLLRAIMSNFPQIMFITGLIIFIYRYFKYVADDRRKPLKPILYSSIISIASYIYIVYIDTTSDMIIFLKPHLLLPSLLMISLPLSFGYSIFRYRLMDFEIVIKKSIIYGTITAAIAAIYVLFVFGLGSLIGGLFVQGKNQTLSILAILVIAFIFDPLKRFIQEWIDRVFYRERYNYQKALLDFSKNLPLQVDMQNIINSVSSTITDTMHVDKLSVMVFDEHGSLIHGNHDSKEQLSYNGNTSAMSELLKQTQEPQNISLLREEARRFKLNEEQLKMLESSGIELAVPMLFQDKLIGIINAGKKKSGNFYSQEDIDLLSTVASQTAIAIENSRLYEKEKSLERVQHEMKLASQIQLEWLPKSSPDIPGYNISGQTIPARVVGGDYFDYIESDNKLIICIGDVSGKGLPAALLMANLQAILRSQSAQKLSTNECIENTNKLLYKSSRDDMFVTLFYGILDYNKNELYYTNAGHNYPILLKKNNNMIELKKGGLVIGVDENAYYEEGIINIEQGDMLILYTDGISEAMNSDGELYGDERLISSIIRHKHKEPDEVIKHIINDVNSYSEANDQTDDMTLIICNRI